MTGQKRRRLTNDDRRSLEEEQSDSSRDGCRQTNDGEGLLQGDLTDQLLSLDDRPAPSMPRRRRRGAVLGSLRDVVGQPQPGTSESAVQSACNNGRQSLQASSGERPSATELQLAEGIAMQHFLLQSHSRAVTRRLLDASHVRHFHDGDIIFNPGDAIPFVSIVALGIVRESLPAGGTKARQVVGEENLLHSAVVSDRVYTAQGNVSLVCFCGETYRRECRRHSMQESQDIMASCTFAGALTQSQKSQFLDSAQRVRVPANTSLGVVLKPLCGSAMASAPTTTHSSPSALPAQGTFFCFVTEGTVRLSRSERAGEAASWSSQAGLHSWMFLASRPSLVARNSAPIIASSGGDTGVEMMVAELRRCSDESSDSNNEGAASAGGFEEATIRGVHLAKLLSKAQRCLPSR